MTDLNLDHIRKQFPILQQQINGKPLVYFDNAATTQKPLKVIQAINDYYTTTNANIHRGVHFLSQKATAAFENSREVIQKFINAGKKHEVIFTKGTTDSINLLANSFGKAFIREGDEILISAMEHHSNIVPWQMVCEEKGAKLKIIPINDIGEILLDAYQEMLTDKVKLIALAHVSNALGTINPVKEMIAMAHKHNIPVMLDGAQAAPHLKIDVQDLDVDFYSFSGHKMYAPMGVGVLYGKEDWLEKLPPYQFGGEMVDEVRFEKTTFNELPFKFEAGTPNVEAVIGLISAIEFIEEIGIENIAQHEETLLTYANGLFSEIDTFRFIGQARHKAAVISFLLGDIHPYDAGMILDKMGIAVRTGHHCAQPVLDQMGVPGTMRASFAIYNTKEEIDKMNEAVQLAIQMLS